MNHRRKTLKIALGSLLAIAVFCIALFFFITSSFFLRKFALPYVSSAAGVEITADAVKLFVFSSNLEAENIRVGTEKEPLAKCEHLSIAYSLKNILKGKIVFSGLRIDAMDILFSRNPSENWNLPWTGKSQETTSELGKQKTVESASPVFLDLENIEIKNSSVTLKLADNNRSSLITAKKLNIRVPKIANSSEASLELDGILQIYSGDTIKIHNAEIRGKLKSVLGKFLTPENLSLDFNINNISGIFFDSNFGDSTIYFSGNFKYSGQKSLETKGNLSVDNFTCKKIYGKPTEGNIQLNIKADYDLLLDFNERHVKLEKINAYVSEGKKKLIDLEGNGNYDLKARKLETTAAMTINADNIQSYLPPDIRQNSYIRKINKIFDQGLLKTKLVFSKEKDLFRINQLILDIFSKQSFLANLNIEGTFSKREKNGYQHSYTVRSNGIDVKRLLALSGSENSSDEETSHKEPLEERRKKARGDKAEPDALSGLNLDADINLKKISYGENLSADCSAKIHIIEGQAAANPILLSINGIPISLSGEIKMNETDGYSYLFKGGSKEFPLNEFKKIFSDKTVKGKIAGEMDNFNFSINGKGFTENDLEQNLNMNASADFKDISFPMESMDNVYVKVAFIPLQILSNIPAIIPQVRNYKGINDASKFAADMLKNTKNIEFKNGAVELAANKGNVSVKKFLFKGPFIKSLALSGNVGYVKPFPINLKSEMNAGGIIVPVEIGGTAEDPSVDMKTFIPVFITKNTLNILTPDNISEILKGAQKGKKGIIESLENIILKPGSENESGENNSSDQQVPDRKTKTDPGTDKQKNREIPVKDILNTLDSIFK